ncbi:hypothetical protein [Rhodovulum kholense]|uniref:Phenylpyruvate tautomerase PptA (4-oxalocrotonate tautomerase family) n=1 Tax=Rhodovulum kholense TaxID=453584 RepID=A0A8E2VI84_9RHOB|nr:hypothetical protein [Rhodovulum kholense]PTW44522.1 hypothetical protein C8N38_11661 [Rhodovulum kholense]
MPFIEVFDRGASEQTRVLATSSMTDGLCTAFGIKPEIVTVYYFSVPENSYAHAGKYGENAEVFRIFVKVHAFPRPQDAKAAAARALTDGLCAAYGAQPKEVIVYFFDRKPEDAFHAGIASA